MTRMWNIDPRLLCSQHLVGEHSEMHEGVGLITCDYAAENPNWLEATMGGQAKAGNIDTTWFQPRHDALVLEMKRRGWNHDSPMDYDDELEMGVGNINHNESQGVLIKCEGCRPRIMAALERIPREEWVEASNNNLVTPCSWYPDEEHPHDEQLEAIAREFDDERYEVEQVA